ncbi:hypothetical protein LCGC14_3025440, partial [marine sediment metagenome]
MAKFRRDVVHRWEGNPLITIEDIPFPCNTVFNAACAKYNGQYILLLRIEDLTGRSVFALGRSENGIHFKIEDEPVMQPCEEEGCFKEYERKGIEDPRITKIGEVYYIMYTAVSAYGPLLAIAKTEDFKKFERVGLVSQPDNKDGVLFPEKINGSYVKLDRPHSDISPWAVWVSFSPDMIHWGQSKVIFQPVPYHWDEMKIGPGATPIKTAQGWLNIYHGVFPTMDGAVYRLGVGLHDL